LGLFLKASNKVILGAGDSIIWKLNCWDLIDGTIEVRVVVGACGRSISTVFTIILKALY
jgi:hypothetical protein